MVTVLHNRSLVATLVVTVSAFVLACTALVTGPPWLEKPSFIFNIPAGNLLAWLMVFSPSFWVWISSRHSALLKPATMLLGCGALWLPVIMLLAGNINLNYSGGWQLIASVAYTGICIIGPLVLILGWWVMRKGGMRR